MRQAKIKSIEKLMVFQFNSEDSDDDFEEDLGSEDSEEFVEKTGRGGRRRNADPVRRSTRARTSRYDADFSKFPFLGYATNNT